MSKVSELLARFESERRAIESAQKKAMVSFVPKGFDMDAYNNVCESLAKKLESMNITSEVFDEMARISLGDKYEGLVQASKVAALRMKMEADGVLKDGKYCDPDDEDCIDQDDEAFEGKLKLDACGKKKAKKKGLVYHGESSIKKLIRKHSK